MITETLLDSFLTDFVHTSLLFFRFFKLHERKCEPVVMTVPRKVSPCFHCY